MIKINFSKLTCVLIMGVCFCSVLAEAVTIKKISELTYDYEVAIFLADSNLLVWDSEQCQLIVYNETAPVKRIKLLRGQGPQEVQVLSRVVSTKNNFLIWDRIQKRFSFFNKEWNFIKIEKFPLLNFAAPLGILGENYVFQWSDFQKGPKGSEIIQHIGMINAEGKKFPLKSISGIFNDMGVVHYDRPFIISAYANSTLYYANNQEYKVNDLNITKTEQASHVYIERKEKPIKWQSGLSDLQYEILNKPVEIPNSIYPKYIPPIFTFFVNGDIMGIVSNKSILQKKTTIDFFKKGKYVGTIKIPLIFNQYFVFPSLFYFNPGIFMKGNFLYTLNYDFEDDVYTITKWEIRF